MQVNITSVNIGLDSIEDSITVSTPRGDESIWRAWQPHIDGGNNVLKVGLMTLAEIEYTMPSPTTMIISPSKFKVFDPAMGGMAHPR
jgi:hypothetical protein